MRHGIFSFPFLIKFYSREIYYFSEMQNWQQINISIILIFIIIILTIPYKLLCKNKNKTEFLDKEFRFGNHKILYQAFWVIKYVWNAGKHKKTWTKYLPVTGITYFYLCPQFFCTKQNLTVCCYHVTYEFQSEFTLNSLP